MLSKQQQEYLCDGYVRSNYCYVTPIAINKLIQIFWSEVKSWIFKGISLQTLLQSKPDQELCHKQFEIFSIPFLAKIIPNGLSPSRIGSVLFRIYCALPPNVKSITIYVEIYCVETLSHFRYCEKLKVKNGYIGWTKQYLQLKQCEHKNKLEFLYFVDILHIEYTNKENFYKSIKLQKTVKYKWDICGLQLNLFKSYRPFQYAFSELFDSNCWSLWCAPKGFAKYEGFTVGVELYGLPKCIQEIAMRVVINIEPHIFIGRKTKTLSCFGGRYYIKFDVPLSIEEIIRKSDKHCISIECNMEINKAFDKNNQQIANDMLCEYGIILIQ